MPALGFLRRRSKSKRRGRRRRGAGLSQRQRRLLLLAAAMVLVGGTVTGGSWWLARSGWVGETMAAADRLLHRQLVSAGLEVREIFVTGRSETGKQQILAALEVRRGQSIARFDPRGARDRLLALGWVKSVRVERRLPDTIIVRVEERQPLALWQHGGRHVLIDRDGEPITRERLGRFASLPVVIGPDAPAHAATLVDMMAGDPVLFAQVEAAVRVGGRRWNLRMKNGVDVKLPEGEEASAWARLARLAQEHDILARDVVAIDLRLPDRLVVRLTPAAAAQRRSGGKDT